jgi:hypothetical protein
MTEHNLSGQLVEWVVGLMSPTQNRPRFATTTSCSCERAKCAEAVGLAVDDLLEEVRTAVSRQSRTICAHTALVCAVTRSV